MFIHRSQPIADQVLEALRSRIRGREFQPDNRLPSESELAAQMQVSRATVRSALSALAAEKWIVRRQGDGTYVNRRLVDTQTNFGTISEFTRMIASSGHQGRIVGLAVATRQATPAEAAALEIAPTDEVISLDRLFLADEQPAIFSHNAIPCHLLHRPLTLADIEEPLPNFFKVFCRQEFTYGISDLGAVTLDENSAAHLNLPVNAPVIRMLEVFYNEKDQPVVYAINDFNAHVLRLKVARSFD